jgi:hypothetical protein
MAMSLCLGASAVWVGTRFVASKEASAPPRHKEGVIKTGYHDTIRSLIYTGRPLRIMKTPYVMNWEDNKMVQMKELLAAGKLPAITESAEWTKKGIEKTDEEQAQFVPLLMGAVAGRIASVLSAEEIVTSMVHYMHARTQTHTHMYTDEVATRTYARTQTSKRAHTCIPHSCTDTHVATQRHTHTHAHTHTHTHTRTHTQVSEAVAAVHAANASISAKL